MKTATTATTQVITGEVRFCYVHAFEPFALDGNDPRYSVCLLIPKSNEKMVAEIKQCIQNAAQVGISKFGGKIPPNMKSPLRDGDLERPDDEAYKGCYFINANSKLRPCVVYQNRKPIIDSTEFYSGCYGHASINFFAFNVNGNRGIACGLNHLMKTRDGEPLGGRSRVEDDFAELFIDNSSEETFDFL